MEDQLAPVEPASAEDAPAARRGPGFTVVGIGASAGGLAALLAFFANVPAHSGLAYVVVVHLSPDHDSHLAELIQPHVGMPVLQVNETVQLEPDRVYVIPPGRNLDSVDTHLRPSELEPLRSQRAPIDHFLRTLAVTRGGDAIGVILTGTGSDGALGIEAIKQRGGLAVVQDPAEAEYDGMPQSALATGKVDLVLPLARMPAALVRHARDAARPGGQRNPGHVEELARLSSQLRREITARQEAAEALRASEANYRTLFESIEQGFFIVELVDAGGDGIDLRFIESNAAFEEQFAVGNLAGRTMREIFPGESDEWFSAFEQVLEAGAQRKYERALTSQGRVVELHAFPLEHVSGRRLAVILEDVTDRRRTEEALRDSEEFHRLAVEAGHIGTWDVDLATGDCHLSPRMAYLMGFVASVADARRSRRPLQVPRAQWMDAVHPEDRPGMDRAIAAALESGESFEIQFRVQHPDGSVRWLYSRGDVSREDGDGSPHLHGASIDNTANKQAEQALRELNESLEQRVRHRTSALTAEASERRRAEAARDEVTRQLISAEEEERRRLSGELHDQMGQLVTALTLGLKALEDQARASALRGKLEEMRRLAERVGLEAHHIALELRPPALERLGLESALRSHLEEWSERHGVDVDLQALGVGNRRFPQLVETTVYRVVQEGLTNVAKHAQASRVSLLLELRDGVLSIALEDDGDGFGARSRLEDSDSHSRLGVAGMQQRVRLVGGSLQIESEPGRGATIIVRVPVDDTGAAPAPGEPK